jgi:hypothetical protein
VTPPLTSGSALRSPDLLKQIVAQFDLDHAQRYQPQDLNGDGHPETLCNVAAIDLTTALGAPLPRTWPDGKAWREQTANSLHDWLTYSGPSRGWEAVDAHIAQRMADTGQIAIVAYRNPHPEESGHIALLVPSEGQPGVWIAQAGARCFSRGPLAQGFGDLPIVYFGHP